MASFLFLTLAIQVFILPMHKTRLILFLAFIFGVSSLYSQTRGTRSNSTRRPVSMGHTAYSRSGTSKAPATKPVSAARNGSTQTTGTNSNKTYHPGITHSGSISEANKKETAASYQAHKAAEKKKADEARKKAAQPEFHSTNTRISPPTPKSKPTKPVGPFGGK
jgi:hypothetical protein